MANFSARQSVQSFICWIYFLFRWPVTARRFLRISLPFFRQQLLFDRLNKKLIKLEIRDFVDHRVINQVFVDHDYGFNFQRKKDIDKFFQGLTSQGKTPLIIDCGANSGMATRYFNETYPRARIVAVEPDKGNMELAKKNNSHGNIKFCLAGIGCEQSRADIKDPNGGNWAYRTEISDEGSVQIISVNKIIEDEVNYVPFIIKIDIEGFESNLFLKNIEWLDKFPVLVIELHDWLLPKTNNSKNFLRAISGLNRDFLFRGENAFSISNDLI